jgi:hypothetical protein
MAYQQFGDTTYVFGFNDTSAEAIASAIGLKPQTLSISTEPEFTAEAKNEDGETASFVKGADKSTFTMTGFLVNESLLDAATDFTFNSDFYILTNRKIDKSNSDFQKAEITGMSYPLITS